MTFNTLQFAVFFTIVLGLYSVLKLRWQNALILVASYVFYGFWDWRFLSLIIISTTVDWWAGTHLGPDRTPGYRKRVLLLSCVFNLGFLGFFKYFGFFTHSFIDMAARFGWHPDVRVMDVVLPIGISFYTFQSMSYTIEVYRNHLEPERNIIDFAAFVAFFPHMVAGPIMRATSLLVQMQRPRVVTRAHMTEGARLILWGLYKKMVVADRMARVVDPIFAQPGPYTFGQVVLGVLAFAFQIYGDFSGYTDIARGTAAMMGFSLVLNFDLPYFATSPQDFWRRWHISLSTWLRDYLYVSLGGNRKGRIRTYVNLLLTMLLGGLWHGASWTFVCWGAYHGTLLAVHRWLEEVRGTPATPPPVWRRRLGWSVSLAFMFCLTLYGWLLFRCHTFPQIAGMTTALVRGPLDVASLKRLLWVAYYAGPLVIVQCIQYARGDLEFMRTSPTVVQTAFYLFCILSILLLGSFDGASFIYFQF